MTGYEAQPPPTRICWMPVCLRNLALHAAVNCQFMCESIVLREMSLRARRRILVLLQVTDAHDYAAPSHAAKRIGARTHTHLIKISMRSSMVTMSGWFAGRGERDSSRCGSRVKNTCNCSEGCKRWQLQGSVTLKNCFSASMRWTTNCKRGGAREQCGAVRMFGGGVWVEGGNSSPVARCPCLLHATPAAERSAPARTRWRLPRRCSGGGRTHLLLPYDF